MNILVVIGCNESRKRFCSRILGLDLNRDKRITPSDQKVDFQSRIILLEVGRSPPSLDKRLCDNILKKSALPCSKVAANSNILLSFLIKHRNEESTVSHIEFIA